jgi:hypothetical protein
VLAAIWLCCRYVQALSSSYKASGSELSLQHLASEAQSRLLAADALVRKYGHERLFGSLLRLEGKEDVESKFDSTIRELQSITNKVRCKGKQYSSWSAEGCNGSVTAGGWCASYVLIPLVVGMHSLGECLK